jgi:class 3 adenylate cyclase/predicted ATPase
MAAANMTWFTGSICYGGYDGIFIMTIQCDDCNHENRDEARFCTACGASLIRQCPACGAIPQAQASFCDTCGASLKNITTLAAQDLPSNDDSPTELAGTDAERRHLTVLFCDLVGSSKLSELLDPEEFRELLAVYQDSCATVVSKYDGQVARYVGDGLLIYFGYPHAHEDDASRAVRAGLEIVESVSSLDLGKVLSVDSLAVRIGIATGTVVVGDIGTGARREEMAVVGETPNLAARLQALAGPGEIIIAAETYGLVKGYFDIDDLGENHLKGISLAQKVYRIKQESGALGRLEASARIGLTPLVGRQEEIAILLNRWEKVRHGESHCVAISGEAGIGKSRIVKALRENLVDEGYSRVLYYGSPYHQNSAFHPVINQLERTLRFESDDSAEIKLAKLRSEVDRLGLEIESMVPPLAKLLSLESRVQDPNMPETGDLKRRQMDSLCAILKSMSSKNPVFLLAEDVHWFDPSSLEVLAAVNERLIQARIFIVMTHRPDFTFSFGGGTHLTQLPLSHLGGLESTAIITRIAGNKPLPDEVATEIIAKTDGIPLYVEELTKSLLESGVLRDDGKRYVLDDPLPPLAIPPSLQDLLMARLDRLAETRNIAQLAACIGRDFDLSLLSAVATQDEATLRNALDQLVEAGLIYKRGMQSESNYEFKHALVRDAAYDSLLKSTRQSNHQRIAQVLEKAFVSLSDTQPELVAQHYTEAGLIDMAITWWYRAGKRAARMDANLEAIRHLENGLKLTERLEHSDDHLRIEADILMELGNAIRVIEGSASERAGKLFARCRSICQRISDKEAEFVALWGTWSVALASHEVDKATECAENVLTLAQELGQKNLELEAHHTLWGTFWLSGNQQAVKHHSECGIELYRFDEHGEYGFIYGNHDPGVCARYSNAQALWLLGYHEQAKTRLEEAIELIKRHSQPQFISHGLKHCCVVYMLLGDVDAVRKILAWAHPLTIETANKDLTAQLDFASGWIQLQQDDYAGGIELMQRALTSRPAGAGKYSYNYYLSVLVEACYRDGRYDEGLDYLQQALEDADKSGERWWLAELYRLNGHAYIVMKNSDLEAARKCFQKAIEISQKQGAKILELRATVDLSRLLHDRDMKQEAFQMLDPVYKWFTEGFETTDLREARTLHDELS